MNEKTLIIGSISCGLEDTLFSYITDHYDGIKPIYIIVPTNLCGIYLSRKFTREIIPNSNVKFITLLDLAKKLTLKTIAERELKEIPSLFEQVLILDIIKSIDKSSYFSKVVNLSGFPYALLDTFKDLSQGGIEKFDLDEKNKNTSALTTNKLKELSKLYNRFIETKYSYKFYDNDYIIKLSAECENIKETIGTDKIAIYSIYDLNYIQWKFIKALADQLNITLFFPYKDNLLNKKISEGQLPTDGISRYANHTLNLLLEEGFNVEMFNIKAKETPLIEFQSKWFREETVYNKPPIKILSCFMPAKEAEEIAREIITLSKQGVPFYEMAIVTLSGDPYIKLITSTLKRAEIPYYLSDSKTDYSNSILRSTVLLINLINSKLPRQDTIDFLQYADIPYENIIGKKFVRDALFDKISKIAGVIEGKDNWLENLNSYIKNLEVQDGEESIEQNEALIEVARNLIAIIEHLAKDISIFPNEADISEYLNLTTSIIKKYIPNEYNLEITDTLKSEIEKLLFFDVKLKWKDFKKLILSVIESIPSDNGKFQKDGVNILSSMKCRGIRFRIVFIPGLSEDAFPTRGKQDPLLLDFEREELNKKIKGFLPLKRERSNEDLQLLALAIDSATEQIYITYPKYKGVEGDDTFPSYYISLIFQTLLGKKPSYNEILTGEGLPDDIFKNIPYRISERDEFTNIEEYDLNNLFLAFRKNDFNRISEIMDSGLFPFIRKGLEQWFMTYMKSFNKYSGLIEDNEIKHLIYNKFISAGISPTSLQDYARCPYFFLLKRILNISNISEPEKVTTLSPILIGSIVHEILFKVYEKLKTENNIISISEFTKYTDAIDEIINEKFDYVINTFPEEYRFLIKQEVLLLSPLIEKLIEYDSSENPEWELLHLESSFGRAQAKSTNILTKEPLKKELGEGLNINISGKLDRIDVNRNEKIIRLIDYKISTHKEKYDRDKMTLSNGLQAFFYTLFSKEHFNDYLDHIFQYRILNRKDNKIFTSDITSDEVKSSSENILNKIKILIGLIREGVFIPYSSENDNDCKYCEYYDICPLKSNIIKKRKTENDKRFSELETLFATNIFPGENDDKEI